MHPDAQPIRICNASVPRGHYYKTGDGEVAQPVRPGSMVAHGLKSAGFPT